MSTYLLLEAKFAEYGDQLGLGILILLIVAYCFLNLEQLVILINLIQICRFLNPHCFYVMYLIYKSQHQNNNNLVYNIRYTLIMTYYVDNLREINFVR